MKYFKQFASGAWDAFWEFVNIIVISAMVGTGLAYGAMVGLSLYYAAH